MSDKSRIFGENISIDSAKVNNFFEARFTKENPLASVMVRGSEDDKIAEQRNEKEQALVWSFFNDYDKMNVLDLGCGLGRWVKNLEGKISAYDGVDFTKSYVEFANSQYENYSNINFHQMSVTKLEKECLNKPYDLIIINGLCMYLNNNELQDLFSELNHFQQEKGFIYLRESISISNERLTLKDFPSKELNTCYNAIYRTKEEYEELMKSTLFENNFNIMETELFLDNKLGVRKETNQRYWLLKK